MGCDVKREKLRTGSGTTLLREPYYISLLQATNKEIWREKKLLRKSGLCLTSRQGKPKVHGMTHKDSRFFNFLSSFFLYVETANSPFLGWMPALAYKKKASCSIPFFSSQPASTILVGPL